jgi:hypothetical protein
MGDCYNELARVFRYLLKQNFLQEFDVNYGKVSAGLFRGKNVAGADRYSDGNRAYIWLSE